MYLIVVILLLVVAPVASIIAELSVIHSNADLITLIGKWFTFWAIGIRLLLAGAMQTLNPRYTAESIFEVTEENAHDIVRELGFGNIAIGLLGALSFFWPTWTPAAALAGGLYYAMAGVKHATTGKRNQVRSLAMITDLGVAAVFAFYLIALFSSGSGLA